MLQQLTLERIQQYLAYVYRKERLRQARENSTERHNRFMQIIDPSLCETVHVAVVKPSAHTQERHTDKYSLKDLALTDLIDNSIRRYKREHVCLPIRISLSQTNVYLLMLQDIFSVYRNDYGEFRLLVDNSLDNDTIQCS